MSIFKKKFAKEQKESIVVEQEDNGLPEISSYEQEPEKVAEIVNNSLKKGYFSEISQKIESLPSTGYKRTQYVFEGPKTGEFLWFITMCTIVSACFLYFATMGLGMHLYSNDYEQYSLLFMCGSGVFICINIFLIVLSIKVIQFAKRYEKYYELLQYKNVEIIDDISNCAKIPYNRVVADLMLSVKKKMIPQGHFTTDNLVFIASDELYSKYESDRPTYDRYYKQLIEERIRMEERSAEIQKIIDIGQEYVEKIHNSNHLIKDKEITLKLNKMEKLVSAIFREVDLNPHQSNKLGMFINYYLPTTEKLLNAYIDINEKKIEGNNIAKAKKDIEQAIDMLIVSFEGILNQFYESIEMDISGEIVVMEKMKNKK